MNASKIRKPLSVVGLGSLLLTLAAFVCVSALPIHAQEKQYPVKLDARGKQDNGSSPFRIKVDQEGTGVWQHLVGPIVSGTFATIPPSGAFGGAGCAMEYSQDQILFDDGSTITFNLHGVRCEDTASPGAHVTTGNYSIIAGTGRFSNDPGGTGTVSIDARADGSAAITITGGCYQGMCVRR
jgi:hypothetical protein